MKSVFVLQIRQREKPGKFKNLLKNPRILSNSKGKTISPSISHHMRPSYACAFEKQARKKMVKKLFHHILVLVGASGFERLGKY